MLLLDTNTVSYFMRGDASVVSRWRATSPSDLAIPAVVEYELLYGIERLEVQAQTARRDALERLTSLITVVPFDNACARIAARVRAELDRSGEPIGPHDVMIAATSLRHRATLVTSNVREFSRVEELAWVDWRAAG